MNLAIDETVQSWRDKIVSALEERLAPPFHVDWVERDLARADTHSTLRVRHPALVGLMVAYQERDPFPDPAQVASDVARHPVIVQAAASPYQTGPLPETAEDLPAELRRQLFDEFVWLREENKRRRAAAKIVCDQQGHQAVVEVRGQVWCGECRTRLDT